MRYDNMWDACINQTKRERSRMHTASKTQGNNNASHRGGNTCLPEKSNIVSRRDGTILPLAEAETLSP